MTAASLPWVGGCCDLPLLRWTTWAEDVVYQALAVSTCVRKQAVQVIGRGYLSFDIYGVW